jgi:proline dehydrogenase
MDHTGKPVPTKHAAIEKMVESFRKNPVVDFTNTRVAFAHKSDRELRKMAWLFGLMNKHWLVGIGSKLGIAAIRMHLPFVESVVKHTIFEQFCGGTSLEESRPTIRKLFDSRVQTILDFGAEGKETEADFEQTKSENIRAIEFGAGHDSVPVVSTKVTGLARFGLLEELKGQEPENEKLRAEWQTVVDRLDEICAAAAKTDVTVYIDAEETWIQDSIDALANEMMARYNRERAVVFNTFQLYCTDRLEYLKTSYAQARRGGYLLGAKLVRGAYLEKERERAEEMGYPSPVHETKEATDADYNAAVQFCVENYEHIAFCNASHNADSNLLQAELIAEKGIDRKHPHLYFCQLYGMSDNLSFNLAKEGYNVSKYVPYGPVKDVVPYLIRRAQENSSVTGDMSREYQLVWKEMKRRGLA